MADNVNHPAHYETGRFECIEVMIETQGVQATMDFCVCNALKYIYRHRKKNGMEDTTDILLKGHGDKSVMLLSQFYTLTEEEVMCIRYHMGAFTDKSEWNDYTRAVHIYPNVLWTHQADMLASHVEGV